MQIGDSLVVQGRSWYDTSRNYYGNVTGLDMDFTSGMAEWCGRTVTISDLDPAGAIYLVEDTLKRKWAAWMFENTIPSSAVVPETPVTVSSNRGVSDTRPTKKAKHCADGKCDIS